MRFTFTKILTSIALFGGCFVPVLVDLGSTHLLNDLWDAHARTHLVWMISSFFLIFILGMYFLWIKDEEYTPAFMSLCVLIGYAISAMTISLYGGVFLGEGGVEPKPFGIPVNVIHFSSMLLIQLISLILLYRKQKIDTN